MHWRSHSSGPVVRPPGFVEPCLPTNGNTVPTGAQWVYEIKHDGFRFVCWRVRDRMRVFSRRGHDWTEKVPMIATAIASLPVRSITIDGEGVVCRSDGFSDFELLRAAVGRKGARNAFLYAFDLLELDGVDLRGEPWEMRRTTLASLLRKTVYGIQLSEHIECTDGLTIFGHACRMGLEGIVAKRRDKPYRCGRTAEWVKIKNPNAPAATRVME
jgi:bifunctional non-homologous end joining protein LigD